MRATDAALPVCVAVPQPYAARARYALEELLRPLSLKPDFVRADDLPSSRPSLVYGDGARAPDSAVRLAGAADAVDFFSGSPERLPGFTFIESLPVPFVDEGGRADLVASTFFWLSGWQEYVIRQRDEHGRFTYGVSAQKAIGGAGMPYVDLYRLELAARLEAAGIGVRWRSWSGRRWAFCATHDVDYVRKWRRGIIAREARAVARHPARIQQVAAQVRRGDPFRSSLRLMQQTAERLDGRSTFLLKGGASSARDVAYSLRSRFMLRFAAEAQARGHEIGIHPSYFASSSPRRLRREMANVTRLIGQPPRSVRSHYLRFDLPRTIRLYDGVRLEVDSTLGFPDQEGFRFATCHPFRLFDLDQNRPSPLWEVPLTFMDASLFNRQHYGADEAVARTAELMRACRQAGGVCVGLWHNVLDDELDYPGWKRHFIEVMEAASDGGAFIGTLRDVAAMARAQPPSAASMRTTSA